MPKAKLSSIDERLKNAALAIIQDFEQDGVVELAAIKYLFAAVVRMEQRLTRTALHDYGVKSDEWFQFYEEILNASEE